MAEDSAPSAGQNIAETADGSRITITSTQALIEERRKLADEMWKLRKEGATAEDLAAWREVNTKRLAAMRQKFVDMAAQQGRQAISENPVTRIPEKASPALVALLTARTSTRNERVKIHNQTLTATQKERQQAISAWQQKYQGEIDAHGTLAKIIRDEASVMRQMTPITPHIPADASPELRTFLTLRHTLMNEQAELADSAKTATPDQKRQVLANWQAVNSNRL